MNNYLKWRFTTRIIRKMAEETLTPTSRVLSSAHCIVLFDEIRTGTSTEYER